MWIKRTKEQLRRASIRFTWAHIVSALVIFAVFLGIYYFRMKKRMPDRPESSVILAAAIAATFVSGIGIGIIAVWGWLENKLHLRLGPYLPGTQGYNMLCTNCWLVQGYKWKLVCKKCGGRCEDAKFWTWVDDEPAQSPPPTPAKQAEATNPPTGVMVKPRHLGYSIFVMCALLSLCIGIFGPKTHVPTLAEERWGLTGQEEDPLGFIRGLRYFVYGIGIIGLLIAIQDHRDESRDKEKEDESNQPQPPTQG